MNILKLLDAVDAPANSAGSAVNTSSETSVAAPDHPSGTKFTFYCLLGGTVATIALNLQFSIDGSNWFTLASTTSVTPATQVFNAVEPIKATHLRANLATFTGTTPTCTVWVAY